MKIGITFSAFDLFHAGHVKMLEDAKRQCDYLICFIVEEYVNKKFTCRDYCKEKELNCISIKENIVF